MKLPTYSPRVSVKNHRPIHKLIRQADVSDLRHPDPIGPVNRQLAHEIGSSHREGGR
jgi:hypothetical protein